MIRPITLALLSAPAMADTITIATSTVTLQASDRPGAIAEVVFDNRYTNGWPDNGDYALTLDGLTVTVSFTWDADMSGSDSLTITPPAGVICIPECVLTVREHETGSVTLYSGDVVGS